MNLNINYIHSSPENFKSKNKFDLILNMEIVENVASVDLFIQNCSEIIKKNGIMFISTINRNLIIKFDEDKVKFKFKLVSTIVLLLLGY